VRFSAPKVVPPIQLFEPILPAEHIHIGTYRSEVVMRSHGMYSASLTFVILASHIIKTTVIANCNRSEYDGIHYIAGLVAQTTSVANIVTVPFVPFQA
jgi:hypothetical protein